MAKIKFTRITLCNIKNFITEAIVAGEAESPLLEEVKNSTKKFNEAIESGMYKIDSSKFEKLHDAVTKAKEKSANVKKNISAKRKEELTSFVSEDFYQAYRVAFLARENAVDLDNYDETTCTYQIVRKCDGVNQRMTITETACITMYEGLRKLLCDNFAVNATNGAAMAKFFKYFRNDVSAQSKRVPLRIADNGEVVKSHLEPINKVDFAERVVLFMQKYAEREGYIFSINADNIVTIYDKNGNSEYDDNFEVESVENAKQVVA